MLASDLYAHTIALALAGVCIAETSQQPIADHFTYTIRMAICGALFEAGMTNAEAAHWFQTLMERVAPFVSEIETSLLTAPSDTLISGGALQ